MDISVLEDNVSNQRWNKEAMQYYIEKRSELIKITSTIDGMPKAKNKPDVYQEILMDLYNKMIAVYVDNEIEEAILFLNVNRVKPSPLKEILGYRNLLGWSNPKIANKIAQVPENVSRNYKKAIEVFEKLKPININQ